MSQVNVTLPDGSSRAVPAGTLVREVAESISPRLAKAAIVGMVDGTRRVRAVVDFSDAPSVGTQAVVTSWSVTR